MTERPLFIDPPPADTGGDVGEAPIPRWFALLAVALIAVAGYVLIALSSGPSLSWRHNFIHGRGIDVPVEGPAAGGH